MMQSFASVVRVISFLLLGLIASPSWADVVTYFHNDIAGTPMAATDASGNLLWKESYRPYGERLLNAASPNTNRLWYSGKSEDPTTGLSYFGARYYNAQVGRFMGIDPKEVDPNNLHSFRAYPKILIQIQMINRSPLH
jgi:RHS repeat-associated protein